MVALTPRQRDTLRFIAGFIDANGVAPTRDEIAQGLGLARRSAAHRLVAALEERGAVRTASRQARSIEVISPIALPRAPDGAPLRSVPIGGAR
ncbi:MAG: helix-turn-helix domain-containing protein [Verrucomicrobiales bacterium]|jgi:SOS-response transcriptional repressor LexA|nr:helix-turn-helix domain-containing protein [Verrucomicrobiales bacterium]|tara:strand:- start:162 stop:440 length:279 start_codon:yes stop_codon:yes gene_type:complete